MKAEKPVARKFRATAVAILLALAACTTTPAVRVIPQRVEIPVAVRCVDPATIPPEPAKIGTLPSDARQSADVLAAKVLELRGWGGELRALLQGCG